MARRVRWVDECATSIARDKDINNKTTMTLCFLCIFLCAAGSLDLPSKLLSTWAGGGPYDVQVAAGETVSFTSDRFVASTDFPLGGAPSTPVFI